MYQMTMKLPNFVGNLILFLNNFVFSYIYWHISVTLFSFFYAYKIILYFICPILIIFFNLMFYFTILLLLNVAFSWTIPRRLDDIPILVSRKIEQTLDNISSNIYLMCRISITGKCICSSEISDQKEMLLRKI